MRPVDTVLNEHCPTLGAGVFGPRVLLVEGVVFTPTATPDVKNRIGVRNQTCRFYDLADARVRVDINLCAVEPEHPVASLSEGSISDDILGLLSFESMIETIRLNDDGCLHQLDIDDVSVQLAALCRERQLRAL